MWERCEQASFKNGVNSQKYILYWFWDRWKLVQEQASRDIFTEWAADNLNWCPELKSAFVTHKFYLLVQYSHQAILLLNRFCKSHGWKYTITGKNHDGVEAFFYPEVAESWCCRHLWVSSGWLMYMGYAAVIQVSDCARQSWFIEHVNH